MTAPAAAATIRMPARGKSSAPAFEKTRPRELSRYFSDLEKLFVQNSIIAEQAKKDWVVYYVDFDTEQIWKTFPDYAAPLSTYTDKIRHPRSLSGRYRRLRLLHPQYGYAHRRAPADWY